MKPIDMLKVGQLFLNNGVWEDHELFDEAWRGKIDQKKKFCVFLLWLWILLVEFWQSGGCCAIPE
jgi:hypothetical protein